MEYVMFQGAIDTFINNCNQLSESMSVSYSNVSPAFIFSNTGRRGDVKYFSITLVQLVEVFGNMVDNHEEYIAHQGNVYVEGVWRDLFSHTISNNVVNALSTVQTLPLYELINKVICVANGLEQQYRMRLMPLSLDNLKAAKSYLESQIPDNVAYLSGLLGPSQVIGDNATIPAGKNIIYYGAPGTGKSHAINTLVSGVNDICKVVTVFHPDTQYSDFVGALKPTMDALDNITYKFRPGPFTRALISAICNPTEHVYLVIEEINRAPAAAVFGELFQLLDRDNGASKYAIDAADPDMLAYINAALNERGVESINKLSIPANLSLFATMNSSDQAVMPMDTAFKRRWSFQYMKIDFDSDAVSEQSFDIMIRDGLYNITWRNFANKVINQLLKELKIPEDRLLGPFFLSEDELENKESAKAALTGKLFVYLWDDVLRHKRNGVIFDETITTFGDLNQKFTNQDVIFGEAAETLIRLHGVPAVDGAVEGEGDDA